MRKGRRAAVAGEHRHRARESWIPDLAAPLRSRRKMQHLSEQIAQLPDGAVTLAIGIGVGMFIGWMVGFIRGHRRGLRDKAARFYR